MTRRRTKLAAELDPTFLWEVCERRASSASPISRASTTARTPTPRSRRRWRCCCMRRADVLLQEGQGTLSQGAARMRSRPRSPRSSASAESRSRSPRGSRSSWRGKLPDALRAEAADAPVQARQERARMEGARGRVRGAEDQSRRAARRVRRDSLDARLPLQRVPRRGVSAGHRVPAVGRAAGGARTADGRRRARSRSTTRRRPRSTTHSRCASSPTATIEVGIHIACPALAMPRGSALDRIARDAAVHGLHAGPQAHDAAGRGGRARSRSPRPARAGAVAVRRNDARRRAASGTRPAWIACPSPPTCARCGRRSVRRRPAGAFRIRHGRAELRVLWKLARHLSPQRAARTT